MSTWLDAKNSIVRETKIGRYDGYNSCSVSTIFWLESRGYNGPQDKGHSN